MVVEICCLFFLPTLLHSGLSSCVFGNLCMWTHSLILFFETPVVLIWGKHSSRESLILPQLVINGYIWPRTTSAFLKSFSSEPEIQIQLLLTTIPRFSILTTVLLQLHRLKGIGMHPSRLSAESGTFSTAQTPCCSNNPIALALILTSAPFFLSFFTLNSF